VTVTIYNTMTRTKEEFIPLEAGKVSMYVCGPTVYDYIHIGNARPMIFFDVVRKYLSSIGNDVRYIVNFTDVDDKLIRKAEQTGMSVPEVADTFIQAYREDAEALGIPQATVHPRVTENIPEIIEFIEGLVNEGYAYESGGDVYFRTARFEEYGKLSHQNTEELQYGIRIDVDARKENPQDFVLWKAAKPGEISWSSPWGDGRPGWHIECSAMARKYLGETLDIHGGGQDLQFPHHECEIAQSESLTGQPLARYWMHNGYIHINNEKMSKSLGNGINVKELLKRASPEAVRYFMLSTHYRNPLNFSDDTITQAINSVERLQNCWSNLQHRMKTAACSGPVDAGIQNGLDSIRAQYHEKMSDDFSTPDAITAVFELVALANPYLQQPVVTIDTLEALQALFQEMNGVLGIIKQKEDELLDEEIEGLIQERIDARKNKQWARADEIRDLLTARGIILEDTPQGVRWHRKQV
jgi:cysteinyl-tRNA synthetase